MSIAHAYDSHNLHPHPFLIPTIKNQHHHHDQEPSVMNHHSQVRDPLVRVTEIQHGIFQYLLCHVIEVKTESDINDV